MSTPSLPPALPAARPAARSAFVNILAWLSLALGLFGVLSGLLQAVVFASMDLSNQLVAILLQGETRALMPPQILWWIEHMQLVNGLSTVSSLVMAVVSWALWQRYEWGRIGFIALLLLGAAFGFAMTVYMAGILDWLLTHAASDPAAADAGVSQVLMLTKATMYAGTLVIALLHAGIAWKLQTPAIRAEFRSA